MTRRKGKKIKEKLFDTRLFHLAQNANFKMIPRKLIMAMTTKNQES